MVVNDNAWNPDERQHFHHLASHQGNRQAGIEPEQHWTSHFGVFLGHRGHAFFISSSKMVAAAPTERRSEPKR
jgi:hypothetical protein